MKETWQRIIGLVEAISTKTKTGGIVSMVAGAIVTVRAIDAAGTWWWLVALPVAAVFMLPGLAVWDFAKAVGRLPDLPNEAMETAVETTGTGVAAGSDALAALKEPKSLPAKVVSLVRGLFSLRGSVDQMRGLVGGALWLKRLASPLYLAAVAISLPASIVIVVVAVIVLLTAF